MKSPWASRWFRELSTSYKLFWTYLIDTCDNAGIWEVDFERAVFETGLDATVVNETAVLTSFGIHVEKVSETHWLIPEYLEANYPSSPNKTHLHQWVLRRLREFGRDFVGQPLPQKMPKSGSKVSPNVAQHLPNSSERGRDLGVSVVGTSTSTTTSTTTSKTKHQDPAAGAAAPQVGELMDQFYANLQIKLGETPASFPFGALGKFFKQALVKFPPNEVQKRIQHWFSSSDPYIERSQFAPTMFMARFNVLKGGPLNATDFRASKDNGDANPVPGKYAHLG